MNHFFFHLFTLALIDIKAIAIELKACHYCRGRTGRK